MKGQWREGVAECAWASKWGDYLGYFWHTFCILKAGATKRERGGREERSFYTYMCVYVCVCVQAPQGATCRRLKWNPWFHCNCAVKLPAKRFHLNVSPTSQLPNDCTIVGLCDCCAIHFKQSSLWTPLCRAGQPFQSAVLALSLWITLPLC